MFKITWEVRLALIHEAGMSFSSDHISLTICNLVFILLIQRKLSRIGSTNYASLADSELKTWRNTENCLHIPRVSGTRSRVVGELVGNDLSQVSP